MQNSVIGLHVRLLHAKPGLQVNSYDDWRATYVKVPEFLNFDCDLPWKGFCKYKKVSTMYTKMWSVFLWYWHLCFFSLWLTAFSYVRSQRSSLWINLIPSSCIISDCCKREYGATWAVSPQQVHDPLVMSVTCKYLFLLWTSNFNRLVFWDLRSRCCVVAW